MNISVRRRAGALAVAAALALPLAAVADPLGDVQTALHKLAAQPSIHGEMHFSNGLVSTGDIVGSDRIRVMSPNGFGEVVIGRDMWASTNGHWQKLPSFMGGMVSGVVKKFRQSLLNESLADAIDPASVADLGPQAVAGKRAHMYTFKESGASETIWIGKDNLPVQKRLTDGKLTTTITYDYTPVSIDPP